jgi:mRNA interferase MazF
MIRGEIWLAEAGSKTRPVVILTRPEVIDVRQLVTVAEITTTVRGLAAEVGFDHEAAGLDHPSAINLDGIQTVRRSSLTQRIGELTGATMGEVCWAVGYALGC